MEDIISKDLIDMEKFFDLMENLMEKSISMEEVLKQVDDLLVPMKGQCRHDYLHCLEKLYEHVFRNFEKPFNPPSTTPKSTKEKHRAIMLHRPISICSWYSTKLHPDDITKEDTITLMF